MTTQAIGVRSGKQGHHRAILGTRVGITPHKPDRTPRKDRFASLRDISNQPWRDAARCNGVNPTLFDIGFDNTDHDGMTPISWMERNKMNAIAAEYCAECPVAQQCLDDALRDPYRSGVYAGYQIHAERDTNDD